MSNGPFLKHHIAVTGDHRCAIFMKDLFDWLAATKQAIDFDGRSWIAFSRSQWEEKLGFTPDQFRLVLEKLTAQGFILRCQRVYRHHVPLHVTQTDKYYGELLRCGELGIKEYKTHLKGPHPVEGIAPTN